MSKPSGKPQHYQPAMRKCLGFECGRMFLTPGPGLRICPRCKRHDRESKQNLSRRATQTITDTRGG